MVIFSVIIPTYNRISSLKRCLAGLLEQDFPPEQIEIIIVSDGSTDDTVSYARSLQTDVRLIVLEQPNSGPAAARNLGIQNAKGKYVLFIDDDVVADSQLLNEHLKSHQEHGENSVVVGPMLTPFDYKMSPWVAWEQYMLERQYRAMLAGDYSPTYRQFYTGNASVLKKQINKVGGFAPDLTRAEDVEMAYRLYKVGMGFVFNPHAKAFHYAQRTFESWQKTGYLYGWNDVVFYKEKDMKGVLWLIGEEFAAIGDSYRNSVLFLLDRKYLSNPIQNILGLLGKLLYKLRLNRAAFVFLSIIFKMQYYQGVTDSLGGKKQFLDQIRAPFLRQQEQKA